MDLLNHHLVSLLDKYYLIAQIQYETLIALLETTNGERFKQRLELLRQQSWRDFVDPEFITLYEESLQRDLNWAPREISPDKQFAVNKRDHLNRHIIGAIRDCVASHGPITRNLAPSAAKRIYGAIMSWFYDQKGDSCEGPQQSSDGKNAKLSPVDYPTTLRNMK